MVIIRVYATIPDSKLRESLKTGGTLRMSLNRRKYDAEFKKNAVKLSYASPKTIKDVADDCDGTLSAI